MVEVTPPKFKLARVVSCPIRHDVLLSEKDPWISLDTPVLVAGEFTVGDGMRPGCFLPQTLNLVCFVALEVSFEPEPLPFCHIAFPGENVGTGAVQEPAIVGNDDGAAGEFRQSVFER